VRRKIRSNIHRKAVLEGRFQEGGNIALQETHRTVHTLKLLVAGTKRYQIPPSKTQQSVHFHMIRLTMADYLEGASQPKASKQDESIMGVSLTEHILAHISNSIVVDQ
jgi:hypothetical protein